MAILPIFVSSGAWIGTEWLWPGLDVWEKDLATPRDYFLPLPNEDLSGSCGKRARYSDARGFSKALMALLTTRDGGTKLLHPTAVDYWTEHSDRAGLDSWLGALMVGADVRRFAGRWAVKGSEDAYVRSAVRIVEHCQLFSALHAKAIFRGGADFFGEEHVLASLRNFLAAVGLPDGEVDVQIDKLSTANFAKHPDPLGSLSDKGAFNLAPAAEASVSEEALVPLLDAAVGEYNFSAESVLEAATEIANLKDLAKLVKADASAPPQGFVVSKTQGGRCRRLHHVGFCHRVPGEHYRFFDDYGQELPAEHEFNHRCKDCFPAGAAAPENEMEMEVSDGEDSSSSSDAQDAPAVPVCAAVPLSPP